MHKAGLPEEPLSLMLVCGEPSGDQLGAQLMAGIRAAGGDSVRITGVGGTAMASRGLNTLFPLSDTAALTRRELEDRGITRVIDVDICTKCDRGAADLRGFEVAQPGDPATPQPLFHSYRRDAKRDHERDG